MLTNEELNKLAQYENEKCVYCHAKHPDTLLDIVEHKTNGTALRCVNVKSCTKRIKSRGDKEYKKSKKKRTKHR